LLFTHHAPDRMRERSIAAEWLERTVHEPEWTEPDSRHPGVERRFRAIPEYGGRVLRAACVETETHIRVISVHFDRRARRRRA
jgi:uncharacterized DUF497 family protein